MWRKLLLAGAAALALGGALVASPARVAQAQSPSWNAQYYSNPDLSGAPVVTRTDANIAFNWGLAAPVAGVGIDGFSVRWGTDVVLSPGTYRFFALADDNLRLIFNYNQTVIDTFASGQVGQTISGDVVIGNAGTYHLQVDYREVTDTAYAFVSFGNAATNPQPNFQAPVNQPTTGSWTSQYFNNTTLAGSPVAIISEGSPAHNWGNGSPLPSVPADNFSARFTSQQNLPAGNYQAQFVVDDGLRFFVNGQLLIDAFGAANGQTLVANFSHPGGLVNLQVDYVEYSGDAYLQYNLVNQSAPAPTPVPQPTGPVATITAFRLNVRQDPNATALILTRVNRNEQFPVVGVNSNATWYQIQANGVTGWVSAIYVSVSNAGSVPVGGQPGTSPTQPPANTGITLTVTPYTVRLRSGPGTQFDTLARIAVNAVVPVVGRNGNNTWYQVNFNGAVGWVSAQFTVLAGGANVNSIPVTG